MAIFPGNMMDDLNDMLVEGMGDDTLWGGMGDDALSGGAGNDRLIGGPGADTLNGGPGAKDIASYTDSPSGVHVDMRTDFVDRDDDKEPIRGGDAEGDALASIEILWGSDFGDVLFGTHAHNELYGNGGSDVLYGERGNDLLRGGDDDDQLWGSDRMDLLYGGMGVDALNGGAGNDILRGGMDQDILNGDDGDDVLEGGPDADDLMGGGEALMGDTAAYTMSPEAVMVDLRYQTIMNNPAIKAPMGGDAMGDSIMGIENLRGSMYDDVLIGDNRGMAVADDASTTGVSEAMAASASNRLFGNMGDDMLKGMKGNDTLHGGKGNDTLYGGDGNDNIKGEMGDDALKGENGADTLAGGPGADKLFGGKFDAETMTPGADDQMDGMMNLATGAITYGDTADYSMSDAGVTIDLDKAPVMGMGGHAEGDELVGIENIRGSMHDDVLKGTDAGATTGSGANVLMGMDGDDMLSGRGGDDVIIGGKGEDEVSGGAGDDTLLGGADDDMITGGGGVDNMDGGAGDDTFVYTGMTIDDEPHATDNAGTPAVEPTDDPTTSHIDESVVLRAEEWNADTDIFVAMFDEKVDGGGGMDTIDASEASFTYESPDGGGTDDGIYIDLNARVLTSNNPRAGTTGEDAVSEIKATYASVYTSIEEVIGGDGNDMLVGNARASTTLMGGGGDDMLMGGARSDMLEGGSGDDTLEGGAGGDTFAYGSGEDTINDFQISVRGGATDKIDLTTLDLSPTELRAILAGADTTTTVGSTILEFSDGNTLRLTGIDNEGAEALEVGDFIL